MQKYLKFCVDLDDYLKFQRFKDSLSNFHGKILDNSTVFCIMLDRCILHLEEKENV